MSYCEVIVFKNGKPSESIEFRNAWGGAARIWDALYDKYLKPTATNEYSSWLTDSDRLWPLADRTDLPEFERAVHISTFDRAVVKREDFVRFAGHLRQFEAAHPTAGVTHLESWAKAIESCDGECVGFYATSCGDNCWKVPGESEDDDATWYDLNTGTLHFDVYDKVKGDEA